MALLSEIDGEQVTLHPNDREAFRICSGERQYR